MLALLYTSLRQWAGLCCFLQFILIHLVYAQYENWNDYNFEAPFSKQLKQSVEAFDKGNYQEADQHFRHLLENYPKAGAIVYRNGSEMYAKMAQQAVDDTARKYYINTSLALLDSVLYYTNDTVNVLNRKLSRAVQLALPYHEYYDEVLRLFDQSAEQLDHQIAYYNLVPYLAFAHKAYQAGKVDKNYLLKVFDKVKQVAQANADQGDYAHKYREAAEKIDQILKE